MNKKSMVALMLGLCITGSIGITAFSNSHNNSALLAGVTKSMVKVGYEYGICGGDSSTWSPFVDLDTLDSVKEIAGFDIFLPNEIEGYENVSYAVMIDKLIQVTYSADENRYICVRKGVGNEDISGDYNIYKEQNTEIIDGKTVTFKGNDGMVGLAIWSDRDYSYFIMVSEIDTNFVKTNMGVSKEFMSTLIKQVK